MIKTEDISRTVGAVAYNYEGMTIQFESSDITEDKEDDAAQQFSLILSIAEWDETLGKEIEKHMGLNGYDGVASCYKAC